MKHFGWTAGAFAAPLSSALSLPLAGERSTFKVGPFRLEAITFVPVSEPLIRISPSGSRPGRSKTSLATLDESLWPGGVNNSAGPLGRVLAGSCSLRFL